MSGYTPLFNEIVTSSIWNEDNSVRIVWITLMALADAEGNVMASIAGFAPVARVSLPDCEKAIEILSSPDKYSRSQEKEGRRIEAIEGGWHIINHRKYREKAKSRAAYMRRYRDEKKKSHQKEKNTTNTNTNTNSETHCNRVLQDVTVTPLSVQPEKNSSSRVSDKGKKTSNNGELFERFWAAYPRKVAKKKCRQIWDRLKPSQELAEQIVSSVRSYSRTEQWQKDKGEYIPHPTTFLNQARWEDIIPTKPEPKRGDPDWLPTEAEVDDIMRDSGLIE